MRLPGFLPGRLMPQRTIFEPEMQSTLPGGTDFIRHSGCSGLEARRAFSLEATAAPARSGRMRRRVRERSGRGRKIGSVSFGGRE